MNSAVPAYPAAVAQPFRDELTAVHFKELLTPADVDAGNEKKVIDQLLEQYKHFSSELKFSKREKLVRSLAKQQSVKAGQRLTEREMKLIVEELFSSNQPNMTPDGKPTYLEFKKDALEKMFSGL